jgi:hypothetical protein
MLAPGATVKGIVTVAIALVAWALWHLRNMKEE